MPVYIVHDNSTTIRSVHEGNWTWTEFYDNQTETAEILGSATEPIDVIIDLRDSDGIPPGALGHLKNIKTINHPHMGTTVLLGTNTLMKMMANMMNKLRPDMPKSIFMDTLEEAHQYLETKRSEILE